jgi:hypothetical protein
MTVQKNKLECFFSKNLSLIAFHRLVCRILVYVKSIDLRNPSTLFSNIPHLGNHQRHAELCVCVCVCV